MCNSRYHFGVKRPRLKITQIYEAQTEIHDTDQRIYDILNYIVHRGRASGSLMVSTVCKRSAQGAEGGRSAWGGVKLLGSHLQLIRVFRRDTISYNRLTDLQVDGRRSPRAVAATAVMSRSRGDVEQPASSSSLSATVAAVVRRLVVSALLSSALSGGLPATERHHQHHQQQQENPHRLSLRHQCPPVAVSNNQSTKIHVVDKDTESRAGIN